MACTMVAAIGKGVRKRNKYTEKKKRKDKENSDREYRMQFTGQEACKTKAVTITF